MPRSLQHEQHFPIKLTYAQRKAIAELAPSLAGRLKLEEPNQRIVEFTAQELREIKAKAQAAIPQASPGAKRRPLRHILDAASLALQHAKASTVIPGAERVFQFKITLLESQPPVWRRIQVKDCTLDKLHEHIQTAMVVVSPGRGAPWLPGQAARTHPDGDGLDQQPPAPLPDRRAALRRPPTDAGEL